MQRAVVIDLYGEPAWKEAAQRLGADYVPLLVLPFWMPASSPPILIDCRGRYAEGIELAARLRRFAGEPTAERVIVTERVAPEDHQRAYLAGVDRIVALSPSEAAQATILEAICDRGGR